MADVDHIPPRKAVEDELERILASPRFRRTSKPSEVLSLLVETALDGKALSGKDILNQVFQYPYAPDASHVRTAVHTLRELLAEYYLNEGIEDPVLIALPVSPHRGRAKKAEKPYTVMYSYSNRHDVTYNLEKARLYRRLLTPTAIESARETLGDIYSKTPEYLPAYILGIECYITIAVLFPSFFKIGPHFSQTESAGEISIVFFRKTLPRPASQHALESATALAERFPDDPLVQLAFAAALLLTYELEKAVDVISQMEELNIRALSDSLVSPAYHLVSRQPLLACEKSMGMCNRSVSDLLRLVVFAFCVYLHRDFHSEIFWVVLRYDPNNWLAYLLMVFNKLGDLTITDYSGVTANYRRMHELSAEDDPIMPGLGCLAYYKEFGTLDDSPLAKKISASLSRIFNDPPENRDWIQAAMALLTTDREGSVKALYAAVEHRNPLALLLPIWPIFDPLREREDFKQLLRQLDTILGREAEVGFTESDSS